MTIVVIANIPPMRRNKCRTGPFEGFFVSSVEFCKHVKFDDKDDRKDNRVDNRTGIQGPAGSPGTGNNNSTLVNAFNCINTNNININAEFNQSSSSSNGTQPIQDVLAQVLNGTLDGQINLNKTIVNLCFINDNDNIVIGGGNGTDGNATIPQTCEDCFNKFLTPEEIVAFVALSALDVDNLAELCLELFEISAAGGVDRNAFIQLSTLLDVSLVTTVNLIECLESVGIQFI
jgi:hypothetical protein